MKVRIDIVDFNSRQPLASAIMELPTEWETNWPLDIKTMPAPLDPVLSGRSIIATRIE